MFKTIKNFPDKEVIIETIKNICEEEVPYRYLKKEGYKVELYTLVCNSTLSLNLGSCLCKNHNTYTKRLISVKNAFEHLKEVKC